MRGRTGFGPWWGRLRIVLGVLIAVWSLAPIYWGIVIAFSDAADIRRSPVSLLPQSVVFDNFGRLLNGGTPLSQNFYGALTSSVIQAAGVSSVAARSANGQIESFELQVVELLCNGATPETAKRVADKTWDLVHDRPESDPVKQRVVECHEALARMRHLGG